MPTSQELRRKRIPGSLWIVLGLLAISVFLNYLDRGNLSIAAPMLKDELGISAAQLGVLLSAFFWTYSSCQLLSGWLVDRLNANWIFAGGFLLWSAATAATGIIHTFAALFVLRLLLGLGESVSYPSYSKIIVLNFPPEHQGIANAVISSGLLLGPGLGMLFGGLLMARSGWRSFFIFLGLLSLLWLLPWLKWMPRKQNHSNADAAGTPSFLDLLRLRSVWGTCLGTFCINYLSYFLITWLPYYLVRERNFSMDSMAKIGGSAYLLAACFAALSGWLADRWILSGATHTLVRKTVVGGGLAGSGIFVGLAVVSSPVYCVVALILGVILFGVLASNMWAITQTMAGPKGAGRWTGFQNAVGNLAGVVAPAVTGFVLQRTGEFYWAFIIVAVVALAGTMSWVFLVGPIQQVNWRSQTPQATSV